MDGAIALGVFTGLMIIIPYIGIALGLSVGILSAILQFGFGSEPRIIAVALASGPMVMINAATGFRRVDLAKIALASLCGSACLASRDSAES